MEEYGNMAIKLKRGLEATIPTLQEGEPGFTTDSKKLFVGSDAGNIEIGALIEVTWQELKDKRDASLLTPGQQYRITDYVTTTVQANTQSAGHQFDIIVTADDVDKLNENARAVQHEGDTYFANSKLEAWKLKYCLDNDADRFAWADEANEYLEAYGVTYVYVDKRTVSLADNGNTEVYFWVHSNSPHMAVGTLTKPIEVGVTEVHSLYSDDEGVTWYEDDTTTTADFYQAGGKGVIYRMIDEFNNDVPYDFKNIRYQIRPTFTYNQWGGNYTFERDASLDMIIADIQYYGYVGDRTPAAWSSNTCWLRDDPATTSSVMYNSSGAEITYGGTITAVTNENYDVYTFSRTTAAAEDFDVSLNGFLYSCYNNTIRPAIVEQANEYQVLNRITFVGTNCHSNTFGNDCRYNTFGDNCHSNTFGNNCSFNTFGPSCYANTFGNSCSSNAFGYSCGYNTFGNSCAFNAFNSNCNFNTFGNSCTDNTFGDYCYYNAFGNGCSFNTFGGHGYSNTFGTDCRYLQISDTSTTTKKYIHVENGTQGASAANKFDLYDPAMSNKNYQVTFKKSASGKYLMLWAADTGTMTGKVKDSNIDNTWEYIV
jgi:hypothetical protein